MKQKIIGTRKSNPAFYDMSGRFPSPDITWPYGPPFRIGDKAIAHIQCLMWRQANPDSKLVILEDLTQPTYSGGGVEIPAGWIFDEIADEIWSAESANDPMQRPEGENLYNECLWAYWKNMLNNPPKVKTLIVPPIKKTVKMEALLGNLGVPGNFITMHPLIDKSYNSYRNASPGWWKLLAGHLAKQVPIVMIGPKTNASKISGLENAYPLWDHDLGVMESLSLIYMSRCHIGGDCGPTHWSPVLRTPAVGVYDDFMPPGWWTQPMSFDDEVPIKMAKLGGRSDAIAEYILDFLKTLSFDF